MGKREKCILRNFMLKLSKVGFESGCHGNGVIGTGLINTPIVFPDNFYEVTKFRCSGSIRCEDTNLSN